LLTGHLPWGKQSQGDKRKQRRDEACKKREEAPLVQKRMQGMEPKSEGKRVGGLEGKGRERRRESFAINEVRKPPKKLRCGRGHFIEVGGLRGGTLGKEEKNYEVFKKKTGKEMVCGV